jgi:hypothetical protein
MTGGYEKVFFFMKSLISTSTSTLVDDVFGLDRIKNFIHDFIFLQRKVHRFVGEIDINRNYM